MIEAAETIRTDVLVIGGGAAGLRAAIAADLNRVKVVLVSKGLITMCGATPLAFSSYQAPFAHEDPADSVQAFYEDTLREGRYLGDENLVKVLTEEALGRALDVERYGVRFKKRGGKFFQYRHAGQSFPRNAYIIGGGYGLVKGLKEELRRHDAVRIFEDHMATRILVEDGGVVGATILDLRRGTLRLFHCQAVILATGGYQELWERTDTPPDCTGDGIALAYRAGADLIDLEMNLYYPSVLVNPRVVRGHIIGYDFLLSPEALAGKALNARGKEILPEGPLPARDVVTRLFFDEIDQGRGSPHGGIYIDVSRSAKSRSEIDHLVQERSLAPFLKMKNLGIDITRDRLEVAPACHFTIGGVRINEKGETSLPGLYAAGEASGNLHGSNRISGNALAETQVFGARAGIYAARATHRASCRPDPRPGAVRDELCRISQLLAGKGKGLRPIQVKRDLKKINEDYLGLKRWDEGLQKAMEKIQLLRAQDWPRMELAKVSRFNNELREALELDLMIDLSLAFAQAARMRQESRGHHFRSDFPQKEKQWEKHTILRSLDSQTVLTSAPVIRVRGDEEKGTAGNTP